MIYIHFSVCLTTMLLSVFFSIFHCHYYYYYCKIENGFQDRNEWLNVFLFCCNFLILIVKQEQKHPNLYKYMVLINSKRVVINEFSSVVCVCLKEPLKLLDLYENFYLSHVFVVVVIKIYYHSSFIYSTIFIAFNRSNNLENVQL